MNKNCSERLISNVLYLANLIHGRYERAGDEAIPRVIVGCEFGGKQAIRTNGDHHGYSQFLQRLFLKRFGQRIGTYVKINGTDYSVGRCAEQRACRFLLDKLPKKQHTLKTVDSLVFTEAIDIRDLRKRNNCIICKKIFK